MSNELRKGDLLAKNGKLYTKNGCVKNGKNYVTSCQIGFYVNAGFIDKIQ